MNPTPRFAPPAALSPCPCGGGEYAACCGRFLDGSELPASAEQLMRSRYSAYVLHRRDYLLATWHPRTRPASIDFDSAPRWLGLQIKDRGDPNAENRAEVEFIARYKIGGRAHRLHERSRFERTPDVEHGRWLYVDGDLFEPT